MDRNAFHKGKEPCREMSLSARRAWIEILAGRVAATVVAVALRKESVDRNDNLVLL